MSVSGTEGKFKIGATELDCDKWTADILNILAKDTNANTSAKVHRKKVAEDGKLAAHVWYDPAKTMESLGVKSGDVTASLRIGDSTLGYMSVVFIVESFSLSGNVAEGLVGYDITAYPQAGFPTPSTYS